MSETSKSVLITGFPSAVSRETAILLSGEPNLNVILLSNPENMTEAMEFSSFIKGNLTTLEGTVSKIDLGLSGGEYRELSADLDAIVHVALPLPPGMAASRSDTSRDMAREIIELGRTAKSLSHIVVLSHLDVAGSVEGVFAEWDLDVGQGFGDPAQRGRFKAEKIYRRFNRDLPITVVRAGWIVGRGHGLCPLVEMLLSIDDPESTFAKSPHSKINVIHLDTVARVLGGLATSEWVTSASTLHLAYSNMPPLSELVSEIQAIARRKAPPGFDLVAGSRRALRRSGGADVWSVRDFFKKQSTASRIASSLSERYFSNQGWQVPVFDEAAMVSLVEKAVEKIVGFI